MRARGTVMATNEIFEDEVKSILIALAQRKNVLISGPAGTGKSRIMNLVREHFTWGHTSAGAAPDRRIPIPATVGQMPEWFPSPNRDVSRKVFSTAFDQNTKHRDFMRGLVPSVANPGEFEVSSGIFYRAALHAAIDGNASLVVVDEINRGPAVAAFGSALVGLEGDKRLDSNGNSTSTTQFFEVIGDDGRPKSFALPADLYVIAAMNEADTSVEPLDVAFLRRFATFRIDPKRDVLESHFQITSKLNSGDLPSTPEKPSDYYLALVLAWVRLNQRISLSRGAGYQLGHGALMRSLAQTDSLESAYLYVSQAWSTLKAHLDEVFFGDTRAIADLIATGAHGNPYIVEEGILAGQNVSRVVGPTMLNPAELYGVLKAISSS